MSEQVPLSRREFGLAVTGLAAAPLVAPADAEPKPAEPTDAMAASADGLLEMVRARYGKHLNDDQLKAIRQSILRSVRGAQNMYRTELKNADEPAFVFDVEV